MLLRNAAVVTLYQQSNSDIAYAGVFSMPTLGLETTMELDENWYVRAYPLIEREVAEGSAASVKSHYFDIGEARGYLRARAAHRFEMTPSNRFKGLWVDDPNAETLLDRRIEAGGLERAASQQYLDFIRKGFCVLERSVPEEILDAAASAHDEIFNGADTRAKFSYRGADREGAWAKRVLTHPSKAFDTHMHSQAIRNLVLHENIVRFLKGLFDEGVLASQSLGFWRGSQQTLHQDCAFVTYCRPLQFVGVWIALEDIRPDSGELVYALESHKPPHYLFGGDLGELSVHEAGRLGSIAPSAMKAEKRKYEGWVQEMVSSKGLTLERFHAKKGDALIWHAALVHGGTRVSAERTRKSIVTHFCPTTAVPTYFERRPGCPLGTHAADVLYSSAHHRQAEPVDGQEGSDC